MWGSEEIRGIAPGQQGAPNVVTATPNSWWRWQWRYDTIRYDTVDLRALKSWRDGQPNLAHGPETKNNEKIKIKNRVAVVVVVVVTAMMTLIMAMMMMIIPVSKLLAFLHLPAHLSLEVRGPAEPSAPACSPPVAAWHPPSSAADLPAPRSASSAPPTCSPELSWPSPVHEPFNTHQHTLTDGLWQRQYIGTWP